MEILIVADVVIRAEQGRCKIEPLADPDGLEVMRAK
jgi:hypothetical protein